jgi:hypothetical protein
MSAPAWVSTLTDEQWHCEFGWSTSSFTTRIHAILAQS